MKILLLGEYSGFFKNLKDGLVSLGHEVDILATGDGFKKTVITDLYFPTSDINFIRKVKKLFFPLIGLRKLYNYDIVQLINHDIFGGLNYNYNYRLLSKIKNKSGKMFLSSCGTNYFVYKIRNQLTYNYVDATIKIDLKNNNNYAKKNYVKNNILVANLVDGIIPTTYTYRLAYEHSSKITDTIPFPINIDDIKFIPQRFNNKIIILHGITRVGFKGTSYIKLALEKLKLKYSDEIEVIIDGKMSLKEYLYILEKTNIVVDQALSYEYGMNAMYSMAMGKVVLSGNEPESQKEFQRYDIPVINIEPSVDDIYDKLEYLILNKNKIIEIGKKSREFVEDFHSHVKVAKQYIDVWESTGGNNNGK